MTYTHSAGSGISVTPEPPGGNHPSWAQSDSITTTIDSMTGARGATATGTVTTTFTWVGVPNSNDDPPPNDVYVEETAIASWSGKGMYRGAYNGSPPPQYPVVFQGSASNGLGSPAAPSVGSDPDQYGATSTGSKFTKTAGGASFAISCSMSATASGDGGPNGSGSMSVFIGYHAEVIATPYDFQANPTIPGIDNTQGKLSFTYSWKSTTGNLQDIADVLIYEHVTYDGETPRFYAPNPPFATNYANPTDYRLDNSQVAFAVHENGDMGHFPGPDVHSCAALVAGTGEFTATQEFRWHKVAIHGPLSDNKFAVLKGVYGEAHTILRKVVATGFLNYYRFTVTKHFWTASDEYYAQ